MPKNLCERLYDAVKNAHPSKQGSFIQSKTNDLWKNLKNNSASPAELEKDTEVEIKKLNIKATTNKASLTCFFANAVKKSTPATVSTETNNSSKVIPEKVASESPASTSRIECRETLCEIWNSISLDKYPVEATYVDSESIDHTDFSIDEKWVAMHIRSSQYCLQIVKCTSLDCCKSPRSNIFSILPERFLPPPMKIGQSFERGMYPAKFNEKGCKFLPLLARLATKIEPNAPGFIKVPYDYYCPSVHNKLSERSCSVCGLYFCSKKACEEHFRSLHNINDKNFNSCSRVQPVKIIKYRNNEALCIIRESNEEEILEWIDIEDLEEESMEEVPKNNEDGKDEFPAIGNMKDWLESPWTTDAINDDKKKF
uniref:C2H2-type domain-containing protein n=1 Tax=Trichogramma kaykai TaxID=54128 RepID=A0ABD2VUK1_9HYME